MLPEHAWLMTQELNAIHQRIEQAVQAAWALAQSEAIVFSTNAKTDAACRTYLKTAITVEALEAKVKQELCNSTGERLWRPLGKLLLIVSENDILGTAQAFLGAFMTGNRVLVKARASVEILHFLKSALKLDDACVQIADWQGGTQDDAQLLQDVDGVVLAGSAELIAHFRRVTPAHIRLIEFGPKMSAAMVGRVGLDEVPIIASLLLDEVGIFLQQVCSSPRFVVVEQDEVAQALFEQLSQEVVQLPQLPDDMRLAQSGKYAELKLLQQALMQSGACLQNVYFDSKKGWGVTLSQGIEPSLWFEKGIHLVVGTVQEDLMSANQRWKGLLQTLGMYGQVDESALLSTGFTRFCPLGTMHKRPLRVPHDGFFEFASFVTFMSLEGT